MANLTPTIVAGKALKNGKHKVRILLTHNGGFRYIITNIVIDSAKEFKNGQIARRPDAAYLNTKLRGILSQYQNAIDEIDYVEGLSCAELFCLIKQKRNSHRRSIKSIFDEYIECHSMASFTLRTYQSNFNVISDCLGENIIMENITHLTILTLDRYLIKRKNSDATRHVRHTFFRTLINYAKKCGYVQYKVDPYNGFKIPQTCIRQSWLTVNQVRAVRDYSPKTENEMKAQRLFMLSYYLGGMNMADMVLMNFNQNRERIKYARQKTCNRKKANRYVEFDVPPEARAIIDKIIGKDGKIEMTENQRRFRYSNMLDYNLRRISKVLNIPNLIFYSARKSFAQHAYVLGVDKSVIEYILGHTLDSGGTCLFSYIGVTPEQATNAIKLVLDNLK